MAVRLKICGITSYEDARVACNCGADALGFIFYEKSPRYVKPEDAAAIIRRLPPFVSRVGVFVDYSPRQIDAVASIAPIDTAQLHGAETPEMVAQVSMPVIKAFAVDAAFDIGKLSAYRKAAFLLDTWDGKIAGGTGKVFDWSIAKRAVLRNYTVILAGGLGPTNLQEALEAVCPYGVDVNSGVEVRPGQKNPMKMKDVAKIIRSFK